MISCHGVDLNSQNRKVRDDRWLADAVLAPRIRDAGFSLGSFDDPEQFLDRGPTLDHLA